MTTIIIKGILTTVGPLALKLPEAEGQGSNRWGNFPVETRGVDAAGTKLQSGYLPATTLRGFLRRAVVTDRMRQSAAEGQLTSLTQAYADLIGQDAASEEKGTVDLLKLRQTRDDNPVLDLFGAGMSMASRLLVSRFRPDQLILPEVVTGARKDLDDTEGVLDLISEDDRAAFFGRAEANSKRADAAAVVKNLEAKLRKAEKAKDSTAELQQALGAAKAMLEKHTAGMGSMTNSSRTLTSYWALPAGINLRGQLVVERARDRDLPMLELALNALSMRPILGAQSARGCGEVCGTFEVLADGKLVKKIEIGGWQPAVMTDFL